MAQRRRLDTRRWPALDRGFTVDSLSVTYMPRGVGVGNADTLQQRARFFGYAKLKGYFGICRVYLEQALKVAFTDYVEHEQIMRGELEKSQDRRRPAHLAQAAYTRPLAPAVPQLSYFQSLRATKQPAPLDAPG